MDRWMNGRTDVGYKCAETNTADPWTMSGLRLPIPHSQKFAYNLSPPKLEALPIT